MGQDTIPTPGGAGGLRGRWPRLSAASLRWAVGLFCGFIGSFILVAPHQFVGPPFAVMGRFTAAWAAASVVAGYALLAVAVFRPRRMVRVAVHAAAALVLFSLAFCFYQAAAWTGLICYGVLGFGILSAVLPARHPGPPEVLGHDLFALLMGLVAAAIGGVMVALSGVFRAPFLHPNRPNELFYGMLLLLSGALLCYVQARRHPPRWLLWCAHLSAGAALIAFGAVSAWPRSSWTGIAILWGFGGAVALQPWLRPALARVDTGALNTRLSLALATAMSVALILCVAVVTSREEGLSAGQAQETLRVEAGARAQAVRDYVEMGGARAAAVASMAGRLPLVTAVQHRLLAESLPVFRDMAALAIVDREARLVARAGETVLGESSLHAAAAGEARPRAMSVQFGIDEVSRQPLLLICAPVIDLQGRTTATLIMAFRPAALGRRIARPGAIVSLADGYGRMIARRRGGVASDSALPAGWDLRVRAGAPPDAAGNLVSFAIVPEFDWVVAVERPRRAALAGVERGRDLAFWLLVLVVPLAVAAGILAARRITRPLETLADAVGELAAGNPSAPLEASRISEVERLSAAFREMRDRLAERTRESERLAAELRARAEALADSDRRKDEFLAMLAHELRNPLGAISTASYMLGQLPSPDPPFARSIAIIQRQIQHLVRLVDDLLDVSRITRGKIELRREPLDLVAVVRNAVESTRSFTEARGHQVRLALPAEPLPLLADATRLEQVLANLLRNSAKFTAPDGRIEIAARRDGGMAVVTVRDTGVGIAPELLPRVFDLFTQGSQGLDRSAGGLGIGLTLVRTLVELHGGQVEARSDGPGRGSEFVVRLPLALLPAGTPNAMSQVESS